jgi:hypothetical protein
LLLLVAIPRLAFAEPKVALAPLDDDDGKIAEIVGDVVSERAKLTKPGRVQGAMRSMGVGVLSAKSIKKLRAKLDVDVVIYGSVEKDGGTKRLSLTFAGASKSKLELQVKNVKQLRKELAGKIGKRIDKAMEGGGDDEDEDEEAAQREEANKREAERKKQEDEARREEVQRAERKRREDEERKREEDDRRRKKRAGDDDDDERSAGRKKRGGNDDDERSARKKSGDDDDDRRKNRDGGDRRRKRVADEDDDGGSARKRLGDEDDEEDEADEEEPRRKKRRAKRHVLTQNALWLDGGGAFARRTLTWGSTGMMRPPRVGTASAAGRLEGEVYPAAFSTLKGPAAGFGISGVMGYTFGLGIEVPNTTITAPIKNAHYAIGARYRFVFGQHSVSAGVSFWRRYFLADRSQLMNADQLDMPDVDYKAIAPGVAARIAVTPKIAAFGSLDLPLMLNSGPIQEPASYGSAKILAFDLRGGAQIIVAKHAALQIAAEFMQVGLSFTGQPGSKASTRMVQSATDRSLGISATIGITY